jgi:catechol-2,3-dioxygenase
MAAPVLSHLVLNTANYEAMKRWYLVVLEATIGVESSTHSACFLRTDETHHRLGLFNVAQTDDSHSMAQPGSQGPSVARLNHFAFEHPTLEKLFETHVRLADAGVNPVISLNHGPTMSMYYQDPDNNTVELFYDSGYTEEQLIEHFAGGDRYVLGGIPFDPAELMKRLGDGEAVAELIAWAPQGQ